MQEIVQYLVIFALQSAAIYAIAASGLVVTYATSGIFNFAHGAIGMVVAFGYWQMTSSWDLPVPLALVLSLVVVAPALGLLLDRVLMRRLAGASSVTTIVATVGLLFALVQIVGIVWPQDQSRSLDPFFPGEGFTVLDINITWHRTIGLLAAVTVAFGLRAFLFGTRLGTAMRAVVDSRELTALNGARPDRVAAATWMLGCSLAGLAGILIAPELPQLTAIALTLLVIQAYAAAMVGRLRSLPLTFVGALILAEAEQVLALVNAKGWAGDLSGSLNDLANAVPVLMLLVVLVVVRDDRSALRPERFGFRVPRPSLASVATWMGGLVLVSTVVGGFEMFTIRTRLDLGRGLALGIVMLSLVLLTGWAGQVSLAQLGLSGLAAVAVWKMGPTTGLVVGVVVCAVVGALVALPALRMRSLHLALTTMAFALLLETVVYGNATLVDAFADFATGGATADRLPGMGSDRVLFVVLAVAFALVALGLTLIRNGPFGRRLAAMRDSPAACVTLGLDLTVTKLQVFALASGIAGLGGGLLAMWNSSSVGLQQYALLEGGPLGGLPLVLVAVIGGVTSVTGALFGAVLFVGMPIVGTKVPALRSLMNVAPGLAGIGLSRSPDGAAHQVADAVRELRRSRQDRPPGEKTATPEPEAMVGAGPMTEAHAAHLDRVLGLGWRR